MCAVQGGGCCEFLSRRQPEQVQPWHKEQKHQQFVCVPYVAVGNRTQEVMGCSLALPAGRAGVGLQEWGGHLPAACACLAAELEAASCVEIQ